MQLEPRNSSFCTLCLSGVDDVRLDHQVVVKKFGRFGGIRHNPADRGGRAHHDLRPRLAP